MVQVPSPSAAAPHPLSQRPREGEGVCSQGILDCFKDLIKLLLHFLVPKSKYSIALRFPPDLAVLIAVCYVGLILYGAVKFYDEEHLVTVGVSHEPAHHDLPVELRPRL